MAESPSCSTCGAPNYAIEAGRCRYCRTIVGEEHATLVAGNASGAAPSVSAATSISPSRVVYPLTFSGCARSIWRITGWGPMWLRILAGIVAIEAIFLACCAVAAWLLSAILLNLWHHRSGSPRVRAILLAGISQPWVGFGIGAAEVFVIAGVVQLIALATGGGR
jgi:hypothetical protein